MDKDTALDMALEALEVANSLIDSYYLPKEKAWLPEIEAAIKAIKQARSAHVQEPVACECNQGQVCHVCDPITPSKQSAQQEPAFWYYTLVVEGQVVGENFTTVNWDTRVEPFGRYDIDHGGKVTKQPLYTTPPTAQRQCNWPTCQSEEYQQSLAEQINQELVTGAAQPAPEQEMQRYSPDGEGSMELDSLGAYVKLQDVATPPAQPAVPLTDERVGRTDREIVDQTEELAGFLMRAFHRREKAGPLSTFRGTQDIRAQHCWQIACQIQEMLTDTDPMNAVANVDDEAAHGITKGQP
jgi:hypothetical protein